MSPGIAMANYVLHLQNALSVVCKNLKINNKAFRFCVDTTGLALKRYSLHTHTCISTQTRPHPNVCSQKRTLTDMQISYLEL